MRLIRQKHKLGCAVACIAMLADLTYEKALNITHPKRKPKQHTDTTLTKTIIALHSLGLEPEIKSKGQISLIKKPSLLVINCGSRKIPYRHAVVWDPVSKKVLDPYFKKAWPRRKYQRALQFVIEIKNNKPLVDSNGDND